MEAAIGNPFEYLSGLSEEERTTFQSEDFLVHVTRKKDKDGNVVVVKVEIARSTDEDAVEGYVIDQVGMQAMSFEFPPIVDVPPAPTFYPGDMTDVESKELSLTRAEKVAEFVRTVIEA